MGRGGSSILSMNIVFFGTPDYVIPVLDSLYKSFKAKTGGSPIVAVVTQKPKPSGRKKLLKYSSVDSWAHNKKIPKLYHPSDVIKEEINADFGILASYGTIIPESVLKHFPLGILNIHPSILPKYRGASPVQATIVSGDKQTAVSIIKLDKYLDHGPIISQYKESVSKNDTTETLRLRLFEKSSEVLSVLLPAYISGKITPRVQDHKKATFTTIIHKKHGFIPPVYIDSAIAGKKVRKKWKIDFIKDFSLTPNPSSIDRFIRAMDPWPICWTTVQVAKNNPKRLKILKAHVEKEKLALDEVQLEGKTPVSWEQFKQGYINFTFL